MVTLRDVATHVGVSVSTVSLVLNDRDEGRVKAVVAEQVRSVAAEMGYLPNLSARNLRRGRTATIGLLTDGVATIPFGGSMLAGAQTAAWQEEHLLLLIDTAGDRTLEHLATTSLLQRGIEALVLAADFHRDVVLPLAPPSVPIVVLNGRAAPESRTADSVVPDEVGGAYAATSHLAGAGHRRIGFCSVSDDAFVARALRRQGYEAALRDAGLPLDPALVVEAREPATPRGRAAAQHLLDRPDRPTAVFCFSDQLAMSIYQVAHQLGLRVPQDLSVVGFDNQQFVAEALYPALTTVQLPHRDMGEWAAHQAISRARGTAPRAPTERLMPCPLVERDSVAPLPTGK